VIYLDKQLGYNKMFAGVTQFRFICNKDYEPERYSRLNEMVVDALNIEREKVVFCQPTYKHTVTEEMYRQYVKTPMYAKIPGVSRYMKRSEISLVLNFRKNLEEIVEQFKDMKGGGYFVICESDVQVYPEYAPLFKELISALDKTDETMWDCINIGSICINKEFFQLGYIEDITSPKDAVRIERRFTTRTADSHLFNMNGVKKLLNFFNSDMNYCVPLDHYITYLMENDRGFKYYWSYIPFFYQRSLKGDESSTIQNDAN